MSRVLVLDEQRRPLMPCTPARARYLLSHRRAAVYRRFPFTILLAESRPDAVVTPLRFKVDPGSKTTGLAVLNEQTGQVVWAAELSHRGEQVRANLQQRRVVRRARRHRKTRYRPKRVKNRRRKQGWLAPSLGSRRQNILTWVARLRGFCPIGAISMEFVRFDTQALQNPEISGLEYQHGTLFGYEAREYLLLKWGYSCAYCGATGVSLDLDHVVPRSKGGSDRISNLVVACRPCNQRKGDQPITVFLKDRPDLLARIQTQLKEPLAAAAATNTVQRALYEQLRAIGLAVETGSGGRTKWNRVSRALPKFHWVDATCVGASTPQHLDIRHVVPLLIMAKGRGSRQRVNVDASGFPRGKPKGARVVQGFRTGDMVRAVVPRGKKAGVHAGRVLVRASGSFDLVTRTGRIGGIAARYCTPIHRADGYTYLKGDAVLPPHA